MDLIPSAEFLRKYNLERHSTCMKRACKVPHCTSTYYANRDNMRFFKFPPDPHIRRQWKQFCGIPDSFTKCDNYYVCEKHFVKSDFFSRTLVKGTVPNRKKDIERIIQEHNYIGRVPEEHNYYKLEEDVVIRCSIKETNATMQRPKILMTNPSIPQVAFDLLGRQCELITTKDYQRASILEKAAGVDAVFWATNENLDAEILDKAGPQMKTVGAMSAGINNIDVPELKKRGIKLGNTPGVLDDAVADIAVLLTLATARRLHEGRLKIDKNDWTPGLTWMLGKDIVGATVGIVGLGGIGQGIVKRLKGFSVGKFLYTGHREKPEGKELGCTFVSLDTLVKESDFVIASCPLTSETKLMFNDGIFGKMKSSAIFVNISRGEVVDQDALIRALKEGKIFAAGLDVMTPEPLPPDNELVKLPNVVLIPHLGSATLNTRNAMAELTAQNILRGLGGEEMFTPVC